MMLTRPKPSGQPRGGGPLSSRGGTLLVAALLSLVAGAALLVFLREYRDDLTASDGVQVLVARSLVPKGTTGEVISEQSMYRLARVKKAQLSDGAITDPAQLEGAGRPPRTSSLGISSRRATSRRLMARSGADSPASSAPCRSRSTRPTACAARSVPATAWT